LWTRADEAHLAAVPHNLVLAIAGFLLYLYAPANYDHHDTRRDLVSVGLLCALSALGIYVWLFYRLDHGHQNAVVLSLVQAWAVPLVLLFYRRNQHLPRLLASFTILAIVIYIQVVWLEILTLTPIRGALVGAALSLPMFGLAAGFVPSFFFLKDTRGNLGFGRQPKRVNDSVLFGFSMALSFTISLLAMFVGHQFNRQAPIPQTQRMLWSNAFFDATTVVTSLYVLERSVAPRRLFAIPIGVMLDLMLGVLFACGSLWIGVKSITLAQVTRVLIAHSADGLRWEFGPYFWAMHTTFLPLSFYLFLILLCWAAKTFLSYRARFYERAKERDGLALTASFLGSVGALLGVAAILIPALSWLLSSRPRN
jgi:hypothetical protein